MKVLNKVVNAAMKMAGALSQAQDHHNPEKTVTEGMPQLLRNTAARMGINKISQKNDSLIFLQENFDLELASYVAANLKGRIMVNMGKEPYLAARILKGEKPIEAMRIALDCMNQFKAEKKAQAN